MSTNAFDPLSSMAKAERADVERHQRLIARRLLGFRIVIVLAFAVLSVKLWDMQIVHSENYVSKAAENRVRERSVKALRGVVYDRNHRQLVMNRPSFDVSIDVEDLSVKDQPAVIARLAQLLKVDPAPIAAKLDQQRKESPTIPVTVASSIAWEAVLAIKEEHVDLPGVLPVPRTIREYAGGPLLSAILGYVGAVTEDEYRDLKNQGYEQDDKIGRAGVELSYEDELRGSNGLQHLEVDAGGREIQVLDEVRARPGNSLELTIDAELQKDVTSYLRWGLDRAHCYQSNPDAKAWTANCPNDIKQRMARPASEGGHGEEGAALVMDVHTGQILAMVAFPQYDNNVFSGRAVDQARAAEVLTRKDHPLINRAMAAMAPASTFKQITAAAALQDRIVAPTSGITVGPRWGGGIDFRNWEDRGYPNMTVVDALAQSNDIWMATVVAGSGSIRGMGIDRLSWYAQQFGLTQQLGIDLPFEQKGFMPTTAWKAASFDAADEKLWYTADSLFAAIGQGFDTATPLQMLAVTTAVANGGDILVPHVARAVIDTQGNLVRTIGPDVKQRVPIEPQFLEAVRLGERKGVVNGSSVSTNLHDVKVAGKTGTAEFVEAGPDGKPRRDRHGYLPTNAWWVGFAPSDEPEIAVAVWIHDAGEGAAFAAPVARKIFARYFHVSDVRNPWGCDTPQSTPGNCANYAAWFKERNVYTDPIQRENKDEDFHDPAFPLPKDIPPPAPSASIESKP